jgi:hypothetical protein
MDWDGRWELGVQAEGTGGGEEKERRGNELALIEHGGQEGCQVPKLIF